MFSRFQALFASRTRHFTSTSRMMADDNGKDNVATFAAGCFWGVEHIFNKYFPELKTTVGYSNGKVDITNPSYRQVCSGDTDFAEALRIEFDPTKVSYAQLNTFIVPMILPRRIVKATTGAPYRSGIYTHTEEQLKIAREVTERVQREHFTPKGETIVTEIVPAGTWYDAEEYHQKYLDNNPMGYQ